MCNPLHLVQRRNSEAFDSIDTNGENTIISFEADAGENGQSIPEKRLKMGV